LGEISYTLVIGIKDAPQTLLRKKYEKSEKLFDAPETCPHTQQKPRMITHPGLLYLERF
jgi:hypothetical protein